MCIRDSGGGSAEIKALYEISPLLGIKKLLGGNVKVEYAPGYYIPGKEAQGSVNWQADSTKKDWGDLYKRQSLECSIRTWSR